MMLLAVHHHDIQYGNVSGWLEAVATVGAAVLAGFALCAVRKAYKDQGRLIGMQRESIDAQQKINAEQARVLDLQARDLASSLAERIAAQAALVYTTAKIDPGYGRASDASGNVTDVRLATVLVSNTSRQPIYDLRLRWKDPSGVTQMRDMGAVLLPLSPTGEPLRTFTSSRRDRSFG